MIVVISSFRWICTFVFIPIGRRKESLTRRLQFTECWFSRGWGQNGGSNYLSDCGCLFRHLNLFCHQVIHKASKFSTRWITDNNHSTNGDFKRVWRSVKKGARDTKLFIARRSPRDGGQSLYPMAYLVIMLIAQWSGDETWRAIWR